MQLTNYNHIIEEIKTVVTQGIKIYRETLIETYYQVGQLLLSLGHIPLAQIAKDTGINERNLQRALQMVNKFPVYEQIYQLPDYGENVSWTKMVNEILPEHKEEKEAKEYKICPTCGQKMK